MRRLGTFAFSDILAIGLVLGAGGTAFADGGADGGRAPEGAGGGGGNCGFFCQTGNGAKGGSGFGGMGGSSLLGTGGKGGAGGAGVPGGSAFFLGSGGLAATAGPAVTVAAVAPQSSAPVVTAGPAVTVATAAVTVHFWRAPSASCCRASIQESDTNAHGHVVVTASGDHSRFGT